jgi:hypothetical protein
MRVHLTLKSSNSKTGPIPVSTTSADTCPDTCPLKGNGCYAESGPLAIHWRKVSSGERGASWEQYCDQVEHLPAGTVWRHAQAGDLPHNDGIIDRQKLIRLARANKGKLAIAYTHHVPDIENTASLRLAARLGFTVNLSANSLGHADQLFRKYLPVTVVLPAGHKAKVTYTPAGNKVITCPAETVGTTCQACKLCAKTERNYIIGFPAHGSGKSKASIIAKG